MQPTLQAAPTQRMDLTERITSESIKKLSAESIKQYLYGKTIKEGSVNYMLLMELKDRKEDISKYRIEK